MTDDLLREFHRPLAELLVTHRRRAKLTQGQLAAELGVTQATVSEWERGKKLPAGRHMERIKELLRITDAQLGAAFVRDPVVEVLKDAPLAADARDALITLYQALRRPTEGVVPTR